MTNIYLTLANTCKSIINDPTQLPLIKPFLSSSDSITLLSVYKVFKHIIPFYKLRIREDNIKHKKEYIKLHTEEKTLYKFYKIFTTRVCSGNKEINYRISCGIVKELSHFNFAEKMILKVFEGINNEISSSMCINTIINFVEESLNEDSMYRIILALLDFKANEKTYKCIERIGVIDNLTLAEYVKIKEVKIKTKKSVDINNLRSKADKKCDKEMQKIQKNLLLERENEKEEERLKIIRKVVDNTMRIYLMILNEKREDLYKYALSGLQRYKKFIKNELLEGLMILLNGILKSKSYINRVECCLCLISIFGNEKYEFKNIIEAIYEFLTPLKYEFIDEDKLLIIIDFAFLKNTQSGCNVKIFLQRAMQFSLLHHLPTLQKITNKIVNVYRIDLYDLDVVFNGVFDMEEVKLEFIKNHPLFLSNTFINNLK